MLGQTRPFSVFHFLLASVFFASATQAELKVEDLTFHKVTGKSVEYRDRSASRVSESEASTEEDKIALFPLDDFTDGSISGYVSGDVKPGAAAAARGFVGIAFRVNEVVSSFEAIYLRPKNARGESQQRRNHSVQYISYPDFPWHRLRKETPSKYESYADMVPGEWIHYRLDVQGESARLYLNHAEQPTLIVNDLKLGERSGRIGLWVGPGTEAHYSEITVTAE